MVRGWKPLAISDELYKKAKEYHEQNKEETKLRHGIRSLTAFISYCIREFFKEKGII